MDSSVSPRSSIERKNVTVAADNDNILTMFEALSGSFYFIIFN